MNTQNRTKMGREIASKYFFASILVIVMISIIVVSVWSFMQTHDFLTVFDDPQDWPIISYAFAVIFQYGQNPALWWGMIELAKAAYFERLITRYNNDARITNREEKLLKAQQELFNARRNAILSFSIFGIFAIVDAGTNIGQFNSMNPVMNPFARVLGNVVCAVIVFVEEFFMKVLNMFFHTVNDIRQSHGLGRWASLDAFNPNLFTNIGGESDKDDQHESVSVRPSAPGVRPTIRPEPNYSSLRPGSEQRAMFTKSD